jgi:peptide/nickel transport system permease protein
LKTNNDIIPNGPRSVLAEAKHKQKKTRRFYVLFMRNRLAVAALIVLLSLIFCAVLAPMIAPNSWDDQDITRRLIPPVFQDKGQWDFILGTDFLGRDILSYIIYGSRVSIIVGFATVISGGLLGSLLGWTAGFYGGWADRVIMRLADIQLSFPYILLVLALAAVVGPGLWKVILVLGVSSWPVYGRIARGVMLSEKEKEYIEAARALGYSSYWILFVHAVPNTLSSLIVVTTLQVGRMIIAEATLGFLGLGVPPSVPTWGGLLADGRSYLYDAWWIATLPGIAIMLVVLSINLLGDALRDILDPKTV